MSSLEVNFAVTIVQMAASTGIHISVTEMGANTAIGTANTTTLQNGKVAYPSSENDPFILNCLCTPVTEE